MVSLFNSIWPEFDLYYKNDDDVFLEHFFLMSTNVISIVVNQKFVIFLM